MAKKRLGGHRGRKGDGGKVISANHLDRNFDVSKAQNIDESLTANNVIWKFAEKYDKSESQSINDYEEDFYEDNFWEQLKRRNETQIKNRHKYRVQTTEQFRRNAKSCPEEVIWTIGKAGEDVDVEIFKECFLEYVEWHNQTFPNAKILDAGLHLDEPNAAPHIHQRQVWFATYDRETGEKYMRVHQEDALEEMGIERPNPNAKKSRYNNAKVTYTKMCRDQMMEIAEAHGIEIERVPEDKTKSGLSLLEYKVRTAQEKLAKTETENSNLEAENTNLKTENANLKKANEDFVRGLEPETTKTIKKFGKEKEVPKTPEEIQRDKEVKAAQAVLQDKDEIAAQKELIKKEREELQFDRDEFSEYVQKLEAELNGKTATMQKEHQQQLKQQLDKQAAEFTREITTLKAENISLKEQMKSVANAIAIRARTMLEKTLRNFGLQMPNGYTVDEQVKTAERYSGVLEQTEIPKKATPKTNDVER